MNFLIINEFWRKHIIVLITEGSRDTEDWSNVFWTFSFVNSFYWPQAFEQYRIQEFNSHLNGRSWEDYSVVGS